MTGTSIDALDVALLKIDGRGLSLRARVLHCTTSPLGELGEQLRRLARQEPVPVGHIAELSAALSRAHVSVLRGLPSDGRLDLIAVHGQTIYHRPPVSWQLLTPALIASALRATVVCDLRAADLAAGGQGAPITPLADYVLFGRSEHHTAVINLGGYCNFTLLPAATPATAAHTQRVSAIRAGDICACNQLLDEIARRTLGMPFDADGKAAAAGNIDAAAHAEILAALRAQAASRRSLGTGDELLACVARYVGKLPGPDLARSACAALADTIIETVDRVAAEAGLNGTLRYLLAGGGTRNRTLLATLRRRAGGPLDLTDAHGVPATYREAAAIAVLGVLCQDGLPITLPQVTGAAAPVPVSGTWIYGSPPERRRHRAGK